MKTDRFADSIRRKLDSIRPDFAERDWVRMQKSLRQAGMAPDAPVVKPFFGSSAARLAAAGIAGTALFLTTTIWQHYELNRVRQTLQQVTQQTNKPATAPSTAPPSVAPSGLATPDVAGSPGQTSRSGRADTVYITRYVPVPSSQPPGNDGRLERSETRPRPIQRDQYAGVDGSVMPSDANTTQPPATPGVGQLTSPTDSRSSNEPAVTVPLERRLGTSRTGRTSGTGDRVAGGQRTRPSKSDAAPTTLSDSRKRAMSGDAQTQPVETAPTTTDRIAQSATNELNATSQPVIAYEPAAGQPMHFDTVHWDNLLAQQAKRMKPARTLPTGEKSPVSRRIDPMVVRVRAGITGEASKRMWNAGGLVELMAGKHWTVGVGLQHATFATGTFLTDDDFDKRMRQSFRRKYARGVDPRQEILNISTHITRVQIPVTVGYRLPITPTLAILPTVGTNLNLRSIEHISFYYRIPFRGYDAINDRVARPSSMVNNLTFSPSVEWQQKRWGWQVGPVLTVPVSTDSYYKQNVTASLRARAFYRF